MKADETRCARGDDCARTARHLLERAAAQLHRLIAKTQRSAPCITNSPAG